MMKKTFLLTATFFSFACLNPLAAQDADKAKGAQDVEAQQLAKEAKDNIKKTWETLLQEAQVPDRNAPLVLGNWEKK